MGHLQLMFVLDSWVFLPSMTKNKKKKVKATEETGHPGEKKYHDFVQVSSLILLCTVNLDLYYLQFWNDDKIL